MAAFVLGMSLIVLLIVIFIIAIVFIFVLEFVIEFLPAVLVAILVYWLTSGNLLWTILAFIVAAILFAGVGHTRRRTRA